MITEFKIFEGSYHFTFDSNFKFYYTIYGDMNNSIEVLELLDKNNIDEMLNKSSFDAKHDLIRYVNSRYTRKSQPQPIGCFLFYVPIDYFKPIKIRFFYTESENRSIKKTYPGKFRGVLKIENNELIVDTLEVDIDKYNL